MIIQHTTSAIGCGNSSYEYRIRQIVRVPHPNPYRSPAPLGPAFGQRLSPRGRGEGGFFTNTKQLQVTFPTQALGRDQLNR